MKSKGRLIGISKVNHIVKRDTCQTTQKPCHVQFLVYHWSKLNTVIVTQHVVNNNNYCEITGMGCMQLSHGCFIHA